MAGENVEMSMTEHLCAVAKGIDARADELNQRNDQIQQDATTITTQSKELNGRNEQIQQHTTTIAAQSKEIYRLENIISSRDAEIGSIKERMQTLQAEVHSLRAEVAQVGGYATDCAAQLQACVAENNKLKAEAEGLKKELAAAKKAKDSLRLQLVEANARLIGTASPKSAGSPFGSVGTSAGKRARADDAAAHGVPGDGTATGPIELDDASATDGPPQKRGKADVSLGQPAGLGIYTPNGLPNQLVQCDTPGQYQFSNHASRMPSGYPQPSYHGTKGLYETALASFGNHQFSSGTMGSGTYQPTNQHYVPGIMNSGAYGFAAQSYVPGTMSGAYNQTSRPSALPSGNEVVNATPAAQAQDDRPEFIMRKDPDTFIDVSAMPADVREALETAKHDWEHARRGEKKDKSWYLRLTT
ncbi:hypothetical protein LTR36_007210 [Oleoguttula mirabilis]|uniref:Uncharacterized protein n=1 Tax=Oleoguttula mirabilis TaxID=1507867 RepID=A0AAV9JB35_9PEZI|nr:hypothetical protein LTR36_007210 [Oleoguttula mirabilis]